MGGRGDRPAAARGIAIGFILEGDIQIRRRAQHVEQRPQGEAPGTVGLQPEGHLHPLDPGRHALGWYAGKVVGAEIMAKLIV